MFTMSLTLLAAMIISLTRAGPTAAHIHLPVIDARPLRKPVRPAPSLYRSENGHLPGPFSDRAPQPIHRPVYFPRERRSRRETLFQRVLLHPHGHIHASETTVHLVGHRLPFRSRFHVRRTRVERRRSRRRRSSPGQPRRSGRAGTGKVVAFVVRLGQGSGRWSRRRRGRSSWEDESVRVTEHRRADDTTRRMTTNSHFMTDQILPVRTFRPNTLQIQYMHAMTHEPIYGQEGQEAQYAGRNGSYWRVCLAGLDRRESISSGDTDVVGDSSRTLGPTLDP
jgi:hypothetical protein